MATSDTQKLPLIAYIKGGAAELIRSKTKVARFLPILSTRGAAAIENTMDAEEPTSISIPSCASVTPCAFIYRLR